jgi:hypothetical protein
VLEQIVTHYFDVFKTRLGNYPWHVNPVGGKLVMKVLNTFITSGDTGTASCMISVIYSHLSKQGYVWKHDYDHVLLRFSDLLFRENKLVLRQDILHSLASHVQTNQSVWFRLASSPCTKCGNPAAAGSCFCKVCLEGIFKCSLCSNTVKGIGVVCPKCHHGGHVQHMRDWFEDHDWCPAGCGCNCAIYSFE